MGLGVSPSRTRRAAVTASAGAPSVPQRSSAWVTLARRKMPCSVRTCLSSPVCEAHMMASSVGVRARSSAAPDSMSATSAKGFTVERSSDGDVRRAGDPDDRSGRVHLDDVAAVAALDRLAAVDLHEHGRRRGAAGPLGAPGGARTTRRWGGRRRVAGVSDGRGVGHESMVSRAAGDDHQCVRRDERAGRWRSRRSAGRVRTAWRRWP